MQPFAFLERKGLSGRVDDLVDRARSQGVAVPSSCESGTCGACRTTLISGVGEHRDYVLDDDEQETAIMICVSRARSDELVLDL